MKKILVILGLALSAGGCGRLCNKDLLVGEDLMIPLNLSKYSKTEMEYIYVWKVNNGDTFRGRLLNDYLFQNLIREQNWLTDNPINGHYSSDLDGSNLYFYFPLSDTSYQLLDSMTDIVIKKSKGEVDNKCYEDDPNVQIDVVSYMQAGQIMGKNDTLLLRR